MNALTEVKHAAIGWLDLLGSRPDAAAHFNATRRGLITMLGVYFVLVTFLAGQVFTLIALNWESVTNGANGLVGIPAISLFGFDSGAALATVVGVLIEVPVMLSVVWIVNRSKGWYESAPAVSRNTASARKV